jgi:hypothetical protein
MALAVVGVRRLNHEGLTFEHLYVLLRTTASPISNGIAQSRRYNSNMPVTTEGNISISAYSLH